MPLPIIPFILKILILKIFKGAFIGFARYFYRIFKKEQTNETGDKLSGLEHINQVVNVEWKKKDNLIFLIIMLSSALYGLQELLVWTWIKFAKWQYSIFFTFTPNSLEQPDEFVQRIHSESWFKIIFEIVKWIFTASLIYWPKNKTDISLSADNDKRWLNITRSRQSFLLRIDKAANYRYQDMTIVVDQYSSVEVKLNSGETIKYQPDL